MLREELVVLLNRFFDSFEDDPSVGTEHRSLESVLKNVTNFVVLEGEGNSVRFASKQFLEANGIGINNIAEEVANLETVRRLRSALRRIAMEHNTDFSKREDSDWHSHRFYRICILD